jgi:hypothetical protein
MSSQKAAPAKIFTQEVVEFNHQIAVLDWCGQTGLA